MHGESEMSSPPLLADAARARLLHQLAALERAGVAPLQALDALQGEAHLRKRLLRTRGWLQSGRSLAAAGRLGGVFSAVEAAVIGAAVQAGSPAEALRKLGDRASSAARRSAQVRARLLLPAAVGLIALVVMPLPALVAGSLGPLRYLAGIALPVAAVMALVALGRELRRREAAAAQWPGRELAEVLLLRLPVFGDLIARIQVQRFIDHLGLLLDAGLPAVEAVRAAAGTLQMQRVRGDFESVLPALSAGASLQQAAEHWSLVDDARLPGLIAAGEGSGRLPELLQRYAREEAAAIESRVDSLATWLPRLVYAALALWLAVSLIGGFAALIATRID